MPDETTSTDTPAPAEPVVAEPATVAEPEPVAVVEPVIVATPTEPAVEPVAEPVVAVEQPTPTAQESSAPQSDDFGLTPQSVQFEALKPEVAPEISSAEPAVEQMHVAPEPVQTPTQHSSVPVHPTAQPQDIFRTLIAKGRIAIQARRRKKLDRIMGLFAKQASITNDDAEKLLHISDATASRYLGILEKEGKTKQVGTAGRWVSYVKAPKQ